MGIELFKIRGHFGDGDNPNIEDLLGFIPENLQISGMGTGLQLQKCLGMLWGRGNPKFRSGDGGKNLGDFYHTSL